MLTLILYVQFSLHQKSYPGQRKNRLHFSSEELIQYA